MNLQPLLVRMQQVAPLALVMGAITVAVAACLQTLRYPFVNDDAVYIVGNYKLAGSQLAELWRFFIEPYNNYEFLPLRDFSYWFDITLFGLTPPAFWLHNIVSVIGCSAIMGIPNDRLPTLPQL